MSEPSLSPEAQAAARAAAERLHHLSLRYVGALAEVACGKPLGLLPRTHPGLREMRDLIDAVLLCRAEINALSRCLVDAKVMDAETFARQMAAEYDWLALAKAKFLGCTVTDAGLEFKVGGDG